MYVMIGRYREKLGNIDHIASILIVKLNMLSLVACEWGREGVENSHDVQKSEFKVEPITTVFLFVFLNSMATPNNLAMDEKESAECRD